MSNGGELAIETVNAYIDSDFARMHATLDQGHYVRFSVSDTGVGMDSVSGGGCSSHFLRPRTGVREPGLDSPTCTVSSNRVALRVASEHAEHIHLLVTDVVMPPMRGPELARKMSVLRSDLKVLYMSGYTDAGGTQVTLDAGTPFLRNRSRQPH